MKRFFLIVLFIAPFLLSAQHHEVGAAFGISSYKGDLDPGTEIFSLNPFHASLGAFYRYNVNNLIAVKLSGNYGILSGDDARGINPQRRERGLSFQSTIIEAGLTVEWNILGYQPYALSQPFSPYVYAGIAGFKFNPKAEYDGVLYELQPLGTEGQGLSTYPEKDFYSRTDIAIPFGGGIKYAINDAINVGLEGGMRLTMTDYIDDVSTTYVERSQLLEERGEVAAALADRSFTGREPGQGRGSAAQKDWYFMIQAFVSYNFMDNGLVGNRGRSRGKKGCPSNF